MAGEVVLSAIIGPLLVAIVGGGVAISSSRPSRIANKAADIVQVALDTQKDTIVTQDKLIKDHEIRINDLEDAEAACLARVEHLQRTVESLKETYDG